jgi:hypothetical protein
MGRLSQAWPLQESIAAVLEADSGYQGLVAAPGIYDVMPDEGTPYPYSTFGLTTEVDEPVGVFMRGGTLCGQQLDIWTNTRTQVSAGVEESGVRICKLIYAAIRNALHQRTIVVAGFEVIISNITLIAILPDPDGLTMHGIVRYDVTAREG